MKLYTQCKLLDEELIGYNEISANIPPAELHGIVIEELNFATAADEDIEVEITTVNLGAEGSASRISEQ